MSAPLLGIHHITAIVGDVQENVDFYAGLLGLRLVKTTVNFDDPQTYHLYFGDDLGRPGTLITFFPWPTGRWGSRGTGQISAFAFRIPEASLGYWKQRIDAAGVRYGGPEARFGDMTLSFYDPAGLLVELVAQPGAEPGAAWAHGPIPAEHAIRGLAGVTLTVAQTEPTAAFLTDDAGLPRCRWRADERERYAIGEGASAGACRPDQPTRCAVWELWRWDGPPCGLARRRRRGGAGLAPGADRAGAGGHTRARAPVFSLDLLQRAGRRGV